MNDNCDATGNEQELCNYEKLGCEGCYHNHTHYMVSYAFPNGFGNSYVTVASSILDNITIENMKKQICENNQIENVVIINIVRIGGYRNDTSE